MDDRHDDLLGSTLLVPTPDEAPTPGTWTFVEREVLSVLMVEDEVGLMLAAFTDRDALERWRPGGGCFVERQASWLFGVAAADIDGRVALNPGSSSAMVLAPAEVAFLVQRNVPVPVASAGAPGTILAATPVESLAEAVVLAIRDAVAAEPVATSARLFVMDETGDGPRPIIMVEVDPDIEGAAVDHAMGRIVEAVAARTDEAGGLTFMVVTDDWRATYATGGIDLYRR